MYKYYEEIYPDIKTKGFEKVIKDKFVTLLPEYYLRPYEPRYIEIKELDKEIDEIKKLLKEIK